MAAFPEAVVINPTGQHELTVVFCSGRGSMPEDFKEELEEGLTKSGNSIIESLRPEGTKWVILSPPERETIFGEMPEWFDLASTSNPHDQVERQIAGLVESVNHVRQVIEEESKLVDTIFLAGISQGFAVASHVLLSSKQQLAGFIGVAGWIPISSQEEIGAMRSTLKELYKDDEANRATRVLVMHCEDDDVIEVQHGQHARDTLRECGFKVEYREFEEGGHEIKETEGFDAIMAFVDEEEQA